MSSFWTSDPSRAERCKEMWAEGASATEIGNELGTSRNSVLSKIHRSGWTGPNTLGNMPLRVALGTRKRPRQVTRRPRALAIAARAAQAEDLPEPSSEAVRTSFAEGGAIGLGSLTSEVCAWPIGNPGEKDFGFCGAARFAGTSYCVQHVRIAYQPAASRRSTGAYSWARTERRYA